MLITGALCYYTARLWRTTAKAVSDSRTAIIAAERGVELALEANRIAERSIVEQNRPWVYVENVKWSSSDEDIVVIFRNSGVRPAKSFRKEIIAHVLSNPFPSSSLPNITDASATFLPPGASEIMTLDKPPPMRNGYEYRIRIGLDYLIDGENRDRLDIDFICRGVGDIRKATPKDYAYYHGIESYTFDLEGIPFSEQPIPDE